MERNVISERLWAGHVFHNDVIFEGEFYAIRYQRLFDDPGAAALQIDYFV